ncbi:hypothetical protein SAMN05518672_11594 [Chitinophaga sp. CF118]|nr:hypothetical protein SAMN05518672_11594 [Chitinophaga sp. CF118]
MLRLGAYKPIELKASKYFDLKALPGDEVRRVKNPAFLFPYLQKLCGD